MYSRVLTQQALDSLDQYFKILEQTGHLNNNAVNSLLSLLLVDDFLNTELNTFVTEEDYNIMALFLSCICGRNCLIPYIQFLDEVPQMGTILPQISNLQPFRITENKLYRNTEKGDPRQTEYRTKFWE